MHQHTQTSVRIEQPITLKVLYQEIGVMFGPTKNNNKGKQ